MRRRSFLKGLLGAAAVKVTPGFAKTPEPKSVLINRFTVAGFQYYQGPQIIAGIKAGDALGLKTEPGNPHDRFAVQVFHGRTMIGYVPRSDNRHLSRLLRQRAALNCRAIEVRPDGVPWQALRIEVSLLLS